MRNIYWEWPHGLDRIDGVSEKKKQTEAILNRYGVTFVSRSIGAQFSVERGGVVHVGIKAPKISTPE
jgi:hypothetical protein